MKTSKFDPVSIEILDKQLKKIIIIVLVVFGVLALRFWFLQIVNGSIYRSKSEKNSIRLLDIPPFRGMILDRNGEKLVDNRPSYDLYIIPEQVQDLEQIVKSLNKLMDIDTDLIRQKVKEASPRYPFRPVCLKRDISRDSLAALETHRFNLPGIMIKVMPCRHYIYGDLACHILGYLGEISESQLRRRRYLENKPGDLIGKSGVEWKWQKYLNGKRGGEQVEVDAEGRRIRVIARKSPIPGENIYLTIDRDLQSVAEKSLEGKKGAIVALNPRNGEILALSSSPPFDPNLFVGGIDKDTWKSISLSPDHPLQNRALCGQYPPGSVFKIVVALAGLEEGVIDPEEEIFCSGIYSLGRQRYRCWKRYGHGAVNLHRSLAESCDVYFYNIGDRLGVDKISQYARLFGLGQSSGVELEQEKGGLMPTSAWKLKRFGVPWQRGETISTSIGQSFVLVTPIQMASLISSVFNGGIVYRPQITRHIETREGERIHQFVPKPLRRLKIKGEHFELVKKALIGVVNDPHGTGARTRFKDVLVAGKTGTAQVVSLDKEEELTEDGEVPLRFRDHAWFVAVAPEEDPQIALAIVVEHGGHGGSASAPLAKELIKAYLGVEE
ncbi:MAG: penicillin-binding protein 2 [Thermodesulfobacteriota bacterium]|nr:penicillin-binding protein 2 [Thermodesulfobacteriota bacterium]